MPDADPLVFGARHRPHPRSASSCLPKARRGWRRCQAPRWPPMRFR